MKGRNRRFFYSYALVLLAIYSCTSDNKNTEGNTPVTSSTPAAPNDKQLLEIGIQKLDEWVAYWRSKGADMQQFELEQEHVYEPVEWPGENVMPEESPLRDYQIPHPGSEGVVDIYSYKLVLNEEQELGFNPDSEVVYYRSDGMRERLLFIGPSGGFEDAVWVTEDHLLVSGHLQKENGYVPVVWLVQPQAHKYAVYEGNFATQDYASDSYLKVKLKTLDLPA